MDSVSQAAFGSIIAIVASGGKQPRRAALTGALLGTLPDLDVLVPQANALDAMVNHRSWSHSWIVQTLVSPLFAWAFHGLDRWRSDTGEAAWSLRRWWLLVWLVFVTHSVLDGLTIYGTWLFWPFGEQPVMGGSTFIIDPLFTLPLLVGLILGLSRRNLPRASRIAGVALAISSAYLGWGLALKHHVEGVAAAELGRAGLDHSRLVATPTPFNSVLWRIVALDGARFHEGFWSLADGADGIRFTSYPRDPALGEALDSDAFARFANFNHGFFAMTQAGDSLIGQDLRMGTMPYFFFSFELGRRAGDDETAGYTAVEPRAWSVEFDPGVLFGWMIRRMGDASVPPLVPGLESGLESGLATGLESGHSAGS